MRRLLPALAAFGVLAIVPPASAWQDPLPPADAAEGDVEGADVADAPTFVPESADAFTDDLYVDVADDASESDVAEIAAEAGLALAKASAESDVDKIEVARGIDPGRVPVIVDALSRDPRVEHVERGAKAWASFVPDDPLYASKQWHLRKVGAESSWETSCGMGVTVAVVDTGVACYDKSPFAKGTDLGGTRCVGGWNFVDDSPNAADDQGHGTHVAGTIAQTTNNGKGVAGLAFCASLMPVKVLSSRGWGTMQAVAQGIRWAADHGAQVINLSLGGSSGSAILHDAVKHAKKKGVIVVAAAGNSGRAVGYPAAYPEVVAVSATDSNDRIAWFSSRGPEVDLAAPGVGVTQQTVCDSGRNKCELFGTFNGTSMASPHVAGAAAVIEALGVTDPDAVEAALKSSATPKGDAKLYGAGRVDAAAAANRVWWGHLALRAAALAALWLLAARAIRKRRGAAPKKTAGLVIGALLGGVGLLPVLPLAHAASHLGSLRWIAELAMRPFGEWDLVFSGTLHRFLLFASPAPSFALVALFYGARRLRPLVGGFALGAAALSAQMAISGDVLFAFGTTAMRVVAALGALVCFFLARASLDPK